MEFLENKRKRANQDEEESHQNKNKILNKVLCQICNKETFKYKCPKCLVKTCSVQCVKNHKIKNNCDGKKGKFSISKTINEDDIKRDMSYLNETINGTNVARKKIFLMNDNEEKESQEKKNKNFKK